MTNEASLNLNDHNPARADFYAVQSIMPKKRQDNDNFTKQLEKFAAIDSGRQWSIGLSSQTGKCGVGETDRRPFQK